ncbi:MAG TPA: ABC transporter ATP-binding protein [Candidatus Eisenbacteria bacterium]|nr:ABC transporter ATP-binding protein [Candidatus Eisenbacteria bacterium]
MTAEPGVAAPGEAAPAREGSDGVQRDPAAIEVQGLRKRYGERTVLDGVDLRVRAGELVALLGPNGAGKTTAVEIIEGYRAGEAGSVRVLGLDPRRGGRALRARVGLMLQDGGLNPHSSPRDVLRLYGAFFEGGRNPEVLLDLVGLRGVARTRIRRLSGGERQRLSLALALVGEPEVLILDEPTAGMDPEAKRSTRGLIAELRARGRTILLTTHDLADVERLADRVVILHGGHVVAEGTPAELAGGAEPRVRFRLAAQATEKDLEALGPWLRRAAPEAAVAALPSEGRAAFLVEGAAANPALVAAVAWWAADRSISIVELNAGSTTLEDRYLELTGDRDVEAVG